MRWAAFFVWLAIIGCDDSRAGAQSAGGSPQSGGDGAGGASPPPGDGGSSLPVGGSLGSAGGGGGGAFPEGGAGGGGGEGGTGGEGGADGSGGAGGTPMPGVFTTNPLPRHPSRVRVYPNGDYAVVGYGTAGTVDLGGVSLTCPGGCPFVAMYSPTHVLVWGRELEQTTVDSQVVIRDAAIDADGDLVIVGSCQGVVDLGQGELDCETEDPSTIGPDVDGLIAKLDSAGTTVWSRSVAGHLIETVAIDPVTKEIVVAHESAVDDADYGSGPVPNVYAAKLDSDGGTVWTASAGPGLNSVIVNDIAIAMSGEIAVVAAVEGTFFGQAPGSGFENWIAWVSPAGTYDGHQSLAQGSARNVAVDATGNVIAMVYTDNDADTNLSCGTLLGGYKDYLIKMSGPGSCAWAVDFPYEVTLNPTFAELRTDLAGNVYYPVWISDPLTLDYNDGVLRASGVDGSIVWTAPWAEELHGPYHVTDAGETTWFDRTASFDYNLVVLSP